MSANIWVPTSTTREGQPDVDSPEQVDRKVKALLKTLTKESSSDKTTCWANNSIEAKREEEATHKRTAEDERARKEEEEKERIRNAEKNQKKNLKEQKKDRLCVKEEEERLEAEARIAQAEEERKQQDALMTPSPADEFQEPGDGGVSEPGEVPKPSAKSVTTPSPSALLTARVIENLNEVVYPEGIKSPKVELNANVRDGRFRYDRDFLLQFMHICKLEPPTLLPTLGVLGIEPVDQSSSAIPRGGSGRHRNTFGAMPVSATRQASVGLGIGGFQKPSVPGGFQMGNFQFPGSKLASEERFALSSNVRSASTSGASTPSQGGPDHPMATNPTRGKRTCTKRNEKRGDADKAMMSQQGQGSGFGSSGVTSVLGAGFEPVAPLELLANRWVPVSTTRKVQPEVDSPELVDRKVKALLNKLTTEKFNSISDQIICWANKSVDEKDGKTLIQVIRLVFEHATDEAAWSKMYARLCWKMMEQISPEVQDDGIKTAEGKPIAGRQLFRMYFFSRCQENIERGSLGREAAPAAWASDDKMNKAVNEQKGLEEVAVDEYYAAQKAKRQGLGLTTFLGELFKRHIIAECIIHECVKKLLGNVENVEEKELESLCQLVKTVGQLLDTRKARAHMDVYFTRMKELGKSHNVNPRIKFMLQDVIEMRDRKWIRGNVIAAPTTIAAVREVTPRPSAFSCAVPKVQAQPRPGVGTHSYSEFVPSMRPPQQPAGTPRSTKTPTLLPSQSARARGPPPSSSSSVASPKVRSHSRRPRVLEGVPVRDGVSVPPNNVGSAVRLGSVVFGSIDDALAPSSSSPAAISAVRTEVVKSFGSVPATSSNFVNSKTPTSASATGSSKQRLRTSLSSTPSNSSTPFSTAATSTASKPKPSRADITKLFLTGSEILGSPPIPAFPRMAPHPHHILGGVAPQVPMQPMQWGGYYFMDPYNQSPPLPTPSTANAPRLNANAHDFVSGGRSTAKVTIKRQDGMEVSLDALKKHSLQPLTVPVPPRG
ncbi:hypothetical protein EDB19DRAFT_1873438 [Suillus lakei]|nr:hypothetical protein EDB19DRAFT_1873438 [Suillus lakei]